MGRHRWSPGQNWRAKKRIDFNKLRKRGRIFDFPTEAFDTIPKEECYIPRHSGFAGLAVSQPPHIILDVGRRFAIYSDEYIAVPSRQIGISGPETSETLLKALSLYLSSTFAFYQQFFAASQWGISKSIATLAALRELPIPLDALSDAELVEWAEVRDTLVQVSRRTLDPRIGEREALKSEIASHVAELNGKVFEALGLRPSERILVRDFVQMNQQCAQGKVTPDTSGTPSKATKQSYLTCLKKELDAFIGEEWASEHDVHSNYEDRYAIISVRLTPKGVSQSRTAIPGSIREQLQRHHSQWMYFDRNLRLYESDTLYCLKPLQAIQWTERQALLDAGEVIAATLTTQGQG